MNKLKVAIIFGGKSAEHEVSLSSAKNIYGAIDKEKYQPILIGIDKTGKWLLIDDSQLFLKEKDPTLISLNKSGDIITFTPEGNGRISTTADDIKDIKIDVAFPVLHGPMGEDGTVQGLLKLLNIPFVGASVLGSAVGMDKDVMKRLLRDAGIPIADFLALTIDDELPAYEYVSDIFGNPFFVKPANMGSSVGVSKIRTESDYRNALKIAFDFDVKIVIEEFIEGREIECSVLGNNNPIASLVGEIKPSLDFYSYEAKYIDEKGALLEIPANISDDVMKDAQEMAIKTFKVLSCEGLGRVDMFLKPDNKIIVNEINTIPGFTKISMYPQLWEKSGIPYPELIDRLVTFAIERFEKEKGLKTNFF